MAGWSDDYLLKVLKIQYAFANKALETGTKVSERYLDGFYSVKGDHGAILAEPETYTDAINSALIALEPI